MDNKLDITIDEFRSYFQLPLCTTLFIFGILPIIHKRQIHIPIIELWGKYSLQIYLWHNITIIILKHIFYKEPSLYDVYSFI